VLIVISSDVQAQQGQDTEQEQVGLPGYDPTWPRGAPSTADDKGGDAVQPARGNRPGDSQQMAVIQQILDATAGKCIFVADRIASELRAGQSGPRAHFEPGPLSPRGFALPAAIGVQTALPHEQVWALADDIGMQATIQELATLVQEDLPIRIAVVSVSGAVAASAGQASFANGAQVLGPDFVRLAAAYSMTGLRARDLSEAESAIARASASDGPVLIVFEAEHGHTLWSHADTLAGR
jgi:acetolactate synthase-1/2/3 large subunit